MREVCMISEQVGRSTPCWWDCKTYCKRRRAYKKPQAAGLIDPADLEGLVAWYRYGIGITSSNGLVSAWADQSGNGNNLVQATETNQPALQADKSILFDGNDNYLKAVSFTLAQPETVYLLFRQITWTNGEKISDGNTTNSGALIQSGVTPAMSLRATNAVANNAGLALNTYGAVACVFNGASSRLQVNNNAATTGDVGAGSMSGFTLGASGGATTNGHIQVKEALVFSGAHSAELRADVIKYLAYVGGLSI